MASIQKYKTNSHFIIQTKFFSLRQLSEGHLEYSYRINGKNYYGNINLNKNRFRILPLLLISLLTTFGLFHFLTPDQKQNFIKIESKSTNITENKEESIEDPQDNVSATADEKYLEESEKRKQAVLSQSKSSSKKNIVYFTHYVREGETLEKIAKKFHVTVESIAEASGIDNADQLEDGQKLYIPNKKGILHIMKKGETLAKVADFYKVSLNDIAFENKLESTDVLKVGQKVFLPGAMIPEPKPVWFSPVPSNAITSGYGYRTYPRKQFHEALDLKAYYEPVRAARSGRIIYSGWLGGYGNVVIMEHENNLKTLYAHNSKLYVRAGDYVSGGKVISRSGCTGYCFGAHLHFEISKDGKNVNPGKFIPALRRR